MRLLVFTTLFPNAREPHHGVFVETRLRRYLARHAGEASVVAPVPLAPPVGPSRWTKHRGVPARETLEGLDVRHPRYLSPPGFGDRLRASLLARGSRHALLEAARAAPPDVLDVHYAFPDGVAALRLRDDLSAALGRRVPFVLTCRGTDLNLVPGIPALRGQLVSALLGADHVICVAEALRRVVLELGVPGEHVTTLRNGVDCERFAPGDRATARRALGLPEHARLVLAVGHLTERKGQHLLLPAFARTLARDGDARPAHLLLVGRGELERPLREQAAALGLAGRVHLPGAVTPDVLAGWYRAADVSVLASSREGWPNVVLESLACGTPVIATRVWGTPEILEGCAAGRLVEPTEDGLAEGLAALAGLDVAAARPWALRHTWDETLDGMHAVFTRVCAA